MKNSARSTKIIIDIPINLLLLFVAINGKSIANELNKLGKKDELDRRINHDGSRKAQLAFNRTFGCGTSETFFCITTYVFHKLSRFTFLYVVHVIGYEGYL